MASLREARPHQHPQRRRPRRHVSIMSRGTRTPHGASPRRRFHAFIHRIEASHDILRPGGRHEWRPYGELRCVSLDGVAAERASQRRTRHAASLRRRFHAFMYHIEASNGMHIHKVPYPTSPSIKEIAQAISTTITHSSLLIPNSYSGISTISAILFRHSSI